MSALARLLLTQRSALLATCARHMPGDDGRAEHLPAVIDALAEALTGGTPGGANATTDEVAAVRDGVFELCA